MANRLVPFRPKLVGEFRNRFYQAVSGITFNTAPQILISLADGEIDWAVNKCIYNTEQRKIYRAVWCLLRDLINASYRAEYKNGTLWMSMPSVSRHDLQSKTATEVKEMLRGWMAESRHERIVAGKEFVLRMERTTQSKKPVAELIADGEELAARLMKARNGDIDISCAVDPHLELVEEDKRDVFTGQKLADIWQYFRLTWSSAYENTPGRTIRYLIRDYAHPMHAVMGIASLENCTVQISTRDDYLGWTVKAFAEKIQTLGKEERIKEFEKLLEYLESGISAIDYSQICSPDVIEHPKQEDINRIANMAVEAEAKRQVLLKNDDALGDAESRSELGKISKDAENALYLKKRSEQLAKLLGAKKAIQEFLAFGDVEDKGVDFCNSDAGSTAVNSALIAQKSKHIGSSMMELNVCGAIPPYNHILGGKLVALLATSPQVLHDYKNRYADKPSEIASRIKGEAVFRPADLVYIGTTSLYYVGSSQYNRLKIPGAVFGSDFDIRWDELGNTIGYGTMHISRITTMALNEASGDDSKLINHVFGEGASPKFRLLTMGISKLLETTADGDPKEFSKHAMSRIVYGACIAKNTREYLLGYDSAPKYYTDVEDYERGTQQIIDFWRNRWLMSRLNYDPVFDRIRAFKKSDIMVSAEFADDEIVAFQEIKEVVSVPATGKKEKLDFVRGFYRGVSAFADNTPDDLLNLIHVQTKLDQAILDDVTSGRDVVLTGNAGDGKTHIVKIMKQALIDTGKEPVFMLDASEKTAAETYNNWKSAREAGKPFVVCINAAILYELHEYCINNNLKFDPVEKAFILMQSSISFHGTPDSYDDIVLYDLNQRSVLDAEFVTSAIKNLTADGLFEECAGCAFKTVCSVKKNREQINNPLFMERLCFILNRVSLQGYHATLRDLQALISYLVFGDKKCKELVQDAGNGTNDIIKLLYNPDAKGEIFEKIRTSFDPVNISHPVYDELILSNKIDPSTWIESYPAPLHAVSLSDMKDFDLRKRQFFFFNYDGSHYIEVTDDIVSRFEAFLNESQDKEIRKQIVRKLDSFFQTTPSNDLVIWTGHRFDNQPRKVLVSIGSLPNNKFKIGRPKLHPDMQKGFSTAANYVRFERPISDDENTFLKIDYGMFELLSQAENGVPVLFMESDLVKKVWRFIEQLQSIKDCGDSDRINYSILDVQTKELVEITVDREEKQYVKLTITHQ